MEFCKYSSFVLQSISKEDRDRGSLGIPALSFSFFFDESIKSVYSRMFGGNFT